MKFAGGEDKEATAILFVIVGLPHVRLHNAATPTCEIRAISFYGQSPGLQERSSKHEYYNL